MNHDRRNEKGKAPMRRSGESAASHDLASHPLRPHYMTVGTGSASEHAAHLQNLLDVDSGYGGSVTSNDNFHPSLSPERGDNAYHGRPHSGVLFQTWYNFQRNTLARSISKVLRLLEELKETNHSWPAHYPSIQRTANASSAPFRPSLGHTQSMLGEAPSPVRAASSTAPTLRRPMTTIEDASTESSYGGQNQNVTEPRLISPQIAQEFSVLKLDLKMGALHQTELVHSLEETSIASLLDGKIGTSTKHLLSLRERIEDTSSKVLITGDLNAGKSTFCNALLRRKVLPEDQQPCTAIFCEVLDARLNIGVEEVHAVHKNTIYNRKDESTYNVYALRDLEKIVTDSETYNQCKVYVKDIRTIDESLLNNGVVDIALIDAPGLNSDTTKTTAIFARQEEIDVVIFVVSAANHFTQSAKEFIWAAAAEKAYLFIVVNGYDTIRDKNRCQKLILEQVSGLSPRTSKESSELVHFVSSNAIPSGSSSSGPSGSAASSSGSGGGGGGGGGNDPGDGNDSDKSNDKDNIRDFEALEQSLRRFVFEKRARSKLAPARTYLLNILSDVGLLATVNQEVARSEMERVTGELKELEPQLESCKRARAEAGSQINQNIEDTSAEMYNHTRAALTDAISHAADCNYGVPYPGIFGAFQYAEELKEAMLENIATTVSKCEDRAKEKTIQGVNAIKQLGLLHVGDEFQNLHFRPDVMFRRKRDTLAREVDINIELWDFVDWSTLLQRQEKLAGTGMALTVAGAVVPRMMGVHSWMDQVLTTRFLGQDNLRQLVIPGLFLAVIAASAYVLQQIPHSLPPRLTSKITLQLAEMDYVHSNATRIASSVRKILRFPADNLRVRLEQSVKDLGNRRDETVKVKAESERAEQFFRNLMTESQEQRLAVEDVDLDSPPHGQY